MHKVKVNGEYNYEITSGNNTLFVNGAEVTADISRLANTQAWHVINNLQSYNAEVVSFNHAERSADIRINNNIYSVKVKDQFDILLDQLGLSDLTAARVSDIKAPMPGLVLKVFAGEGMEVKKGDNLFVLEAMKMENIIKAPADVVVKTVKIKPGDKVEKGQILMVF